MRPTTRPRTRAWRPSDSRPTTPSFASRRRRIDLIDTLVWHHDGPFGDSSAVPTYLVSKLTREQVTVVLTGDGGDELFAGYLRFYAALLAERMPAAVGRVAHAACCRACRRRPTIGTGWPGRSGLPSRWARRSTIA